MEDAERRAIERMTNDDLRILVVVLGKRLDVISDVLVAIMMPIFLLAFCGALATLRFVLHS